MIESQPGVYYNFPMQDSLQLLKGQQVEVVYNGMIYKGRLTGASGQEIYLETSEQRVSLPMEGITDVRRASKSRLFRGLEESSPQGGQEE